MKYVRFNATSSTLQGKMPTWCGHLWVITSGHLLKKFITYSYAQFHQIQKSNEINHLLAYAGDNLVKAFMTAGFNCRTDITNPAQAGDYTMTEIF